MVLIRSIFARILLPVLAPLIDANAAPGARAPTASAPAPGSTIRD